MTVDIETLIRQSNALREANAVLRDALEAMLSLITSGKHYETQNPYTRPEVEQAFKALGRDWRTE